MGAPRTALRSNGGFWQLEGNVEHGRLQSIWTLYTNGQLAAGFRTKIGILRQPPCSPVKAAHGPTRAVAVPAERTMALLAFEDMRNSPVADLMDISQRQKTASELNAAILSSQCQACTPLGNRC